MTGEETQQARGWLLTLSAEHYDRDTVVQNLASYPHVGQLERGEGGYEHWQVYVENSSPIRFSTLKKCFPQGHFEKRRGTKQQAYEYCTKQESRVSDEPQLSNREDEISLENNQGKRSDLQAIHADLINGATPNEVRLKYSSALRLNVGIEGLAEAVSYERGQREREVTVTWMYGQPGVGKTRWVFDSFPSEEIYRVTNYRNPFDQYQRQAVLVLDEYVGQLPLELFLNVADRYPLKLPARYRDPWALHTTLVVVSNLAPWEVYTPASFGSKQCGAVRRRLHHVAQMRDNGIVVEDSTEYINEQWRLRTDDFGLAG